jgi:hypothetical protein
MVELLHSWTHHFSATNLTHAQSCSEKNPQIQHKMCIHRLSS